LELYFYIKVWDFQNHLWGWNSVIPLSYIWDIVGN
jgi:hypothetical protein